MTLLKDCALILIGICISLQVQAIVQRRKQMGKPKSRPSTPRRNTITSAPASIRRVSSANEISELLPPHVLPHSHSDIWQSKQCLNYHEKDENSGGLLVLMRHGQSVWNRKPAQPDKLWRYAGTVDIPLSEVGIQEALEAGHYLQQTPFDLVFCSQMDRARSTVALALSIHDSGKTPVVVHSSPLDPPEFIDLNHHDPTRFVLPVYVTAALNERHFGSLQGVPSNEHPTGLAPIRNEYRLKFPGLKGESCADVEARAMPFFHEFIVPHLAAGKNVLISTHGFVIRTMIKCLEGIDDEAYLAQMKLEKTAPADCRLLAPTGIPLMYRYEPDGTFSPVAAENKRGRARSIARSASSTTN